MGEDGLVIIILVVVYVAIAIASATIAGHKGRSAFGWLILTLIFPIAILFVLIASSVPLPTRSTPPKKLSGGLIGYSAGLSATPTTAPNNQPSPSGHTEALDWEKLLKYDPDVAKAVDKLQAFGEAAVEEFKGAYDAVGGDRSVINHITDVIIKDFELKETERREGEERKPFEVRMRQQEQEARYAKVLQVLDEEKNNKLEKLLSLLNAQLVRNRSHDSVYVKLGASRGFTIPSTREDDMIPNIIKKLSDDEFYVLYAAITDSQ